MSAEKIFTLSWEHLHNPALRLLAAYGHRFAEALLGLRALSRVYAALQQTPDTRPFAERILEAFKTRPIWSADDAARIPASGALVIVANHPYGAMEGLALQTLVRQRRQDVKVLANYLLGRIPELREEMIFVDPFGMAGSARRNVQSLRQALQWLREGHALITFPSGEVAGVARHAWRVREAPWHTSMMALIRQGGADVRVLPVFIPGRASLLFHLVGKIHPRLRTLLLPREMLRLRKRSVTLHTGDPIPLNSITQRFPSDEEALRYLRWRTFVLAGREASSKFDEQMRRLTLEREETVQEPLIDPIDVEQIEAELAALPPDALLVSEGAYALYAAQGEAIPATLREIGRLRELAFRAAGEGTGQMLDTDSFDAAYYQIVLWHRERREIVGCYRLALSDVLAERDGLHALYTRTLFRFDEQFLNSLPGPAVELGRSFVRPAYQRTFAPLLLLWRGVLTFLAHNPRYTVLFGPVSISHDFRKAARELLLEHLTAQCFDWSLARWVSARLPPKRPQWVEWNHPDYADFIANEGDVATALHEMEEGRHEMPVLIRQYLKLGGKIVAFNVDPEFGTVVDGLIVVDLLSASPRAIARYMGAEAYAAYRAAPREEG